MREKVCQIWVGGTDLALMLRNIGGWWVGCFNERDNIVAVQYATKKGWLQKRTHYAPAFPDGVECWELTDAGLAYLGEVAGPRAMGGADKMRNWYRTHNKKWLQAQHNGGPPPLAEDNALT